MYDFTDLILGCLYCGKIVDPPTQRALEILGDSVFQCCNHRMIEIDECNLFKATKGIEVLKENIEKRYLKGV